VLVVGAGPTGLAMACELSRHGVICRIIDKGNGPSRLSRAVAIHARTLELFENIGIVDKVLEQGSRCAAITLYDNNSKMVSVTFEQLHTKYPFLHLLPQHKTEAILLEHLADYELEVEWGKELISLNEEGNTVEAEIRDSTGRVEKARFSYMVGADGAQSRVREELDVKFEGASNPSYWLLADCEVNWEHPKDELAVFFHKEGATAFFPIDQNHSRVMFELKTKPEEQGPTLETVAKIAARRNIKFQSLLDIQWISYFKLHQRLAEQYQTGRVFLAGDAAHIQSPIGSQGMNTGIQDAYNLAWKLGLVINGHAKPELLDSYQVERQPIGEELVALSDTATHMIGITNPVFRTLRSALIPIIARFQSVQHRILGTLSQIELHYRESPIVGEDWKPFKDLGSAELRAGERVDDFRLFSFDYLPSRNLYDLLTGAEHELFMFTGLEPDEFEMETLRVTHRTLTKRYGRLVELHLICARRDALWWDPKQTQHPEAVRSSYIDKDFVLHKAFNARNASFYLVRPDGYVAYRNQPADMGQLEAFLAKLFNAQP